MRRAQQRGRPILHQVRLHVAPGRPGWGREFPSAGPGDSDDGPRFRSPSDRGVASPSPHRAPSDGYSRSLRVGRLRGVGPSRSRSGRADSPSPEREVLYPMSDRDQPGRGFLSGMSATSIVKKTGRKGRRTRAMVRIARDRVSQLFALAERESLGGHPEIADRYVTLARRIGMRYNVRLLREYRELYCRTCSAYWVEGRTVRTRLRSGRRVRTCLRCGRQRRTVSHLSGASSPLSGGFREIRREEGALSVPIAEESDFTDEETEDE